MFNPDALRTVSQMSPWEYFHRGCAETVTFGSGMARLNRAMKSLLASCEQDEEEAPEPDIQTENYWGCERSI